MKKTALYAFSGDPITIGHINIIERVSKIFDNVIVGIGVNQSKTYTFSLEDRENMANRALANFDNVTVISFDGLLVDIAYENNVDVIIRGIRNSEDFEFESMLNNINHTQNHNIETMCVFADQNLSHISSGAVKGLVRSTGFIHNFVPLNVKEMLEKEINNTFVLGLTGTIGSGKSYIADYIHVHLGLDVLHLDLDAIAHNILNKNTEPAYVKIRQEIGDVFQIHADTIIKRQDTPKILDEDGFVNRTVLGEIVFTDQVYVNLLNSIMREPLLVQIRKRMRGFKNGVILIDGALLIEFDLNVLCNNNMIILDVDDDQQKLRLKKRGHLPMQIEDRVMSQYSTEKKEDTLIASQFKHNHGSHIVIDNSCVHTNSGPKEAVQYIRKHAGFVSMIDRHTLEL